MAQQRRTQITIETERIVLLRQARTTSRLCCPVCSQLMVSVDEAARLAGVSTRVIYTLVEADQLHFTEATEGRLFVCPKSLLNHWRTI